MTAVAPPPEGRRVSVQRAVRAMPVTAAAEPVRSSRKPAGRLVSAHRAARRLEEAKQGALRADRVVAARARVTAVHR